MAIHDRFTGSFITLQNFFSFWYEILSITDIKEDTKGELPCPTLGVKATKNGFEMLYSKQFIEDKKLTDTNITAILIHEVCHLLFRHTTRGKGYKQAVANIAMDMIINSLLSKNVDKRFAELPDGAYYVPKEYLGEWIFEDLYAWLMQTDPQTGNDNSDGQNDGGNQGDGDGQGNGDNDEKEDDQNGGGKGKDEPQKQPKSNTGGQKPSDKKGPNGQNGETQEGTKQILEDCQSENTQGKPIDAHMEDEISQEMKDGLVEEALARCSARGLIKGEASEMLKGLRKQKRDYLSEIKKQLGWMIGNKKYFTWARPNRKGLPFKGFKKYKVALNCLLDTSGSMGGTFDKVLSYIFQNGIEVNLIQCDTEVQAKMKIKSKRDFRKLTIKGLGGTTLQPGVDYIEKTLNKNPTVILTDGVTDILDFGKLHKRVLILTTENECPVSGGLNKVKQIVLPKTEVK